VLTLSLGSCVHGSLLGLSLSSPSIFVVVLGFELSALSLPALYHLSHAPALIVPPLALRPELLVEGAYPSHLPLLILSRDILFSLL
jgi:hypothetical protein